MTKRHVAIGLLGALSGLPAAVVAAGLSTVPYRTGEVVVRYRDEAAGGQAAIKALTVEHGLAVKAELVPGRLDLVTLPSVMDVPGAVAMLAADPRVLYAEPNYLRRKLGVTPNDPSFPDQWGLSNTGQANFVAGGPAGLAGGDLHLSVAWDLDGDGKADHTGRGNVVVAIVDDAVETTHPDLAANLVAGYNFVDNNTNPNPAPTKDDAQDHGTAVAGCVAAVGNNGVGVSGAAWNEHLMPIKFGFDTASEVAAYRFARSNGAKIVNASFGGPGWSRAELDAINDLAANDVLLVAAAGNEDASLDVAGASYPANYDAPNVVAVAATNRQDGVASFSSYGPTTVPVAAPGLQIVTTAVNGGYTTSPGVSGTSFSSPYAAGVAALIRDYFPSAGYAEVKARLIEGADTGVDASNPVNRRTSGGRVNAANALSLAARPSLVIQPVVVGSYSQNSQENGAQTVPVRVPVKLIDNGNGVLDPGETATLQITVGNLWQAATHVSGTLSANNGVSVAGGAVSFGDIASQGSAVGSFVVSVPATLVGHQFVDFALKLSADGGYATTRYFTLELGRLQDGVAVTQTIQTNLYDDFHTWHFDVTSVPPDDQLVISTTAANNVDLLVSYGAPPQYNIELNAASDGSYYVNQPDAQIGRGSSGNEKVTIARPQVGTYYVTVLNFDRKTNASYTLKASLERPSLPSGGGGPVSPAVFALLAVAALTRAMRARNPQRRSVDALARARARIQRNRA